MEDGRYIIEKRMRERGEKTYTRECVISSCHCQIIIDRLLIVYGIKKM
jgi:hypothetical protein